MTSALTARVSHFSLGLLNLGERGGPGVSDVIDRAAPGRRRCTRDLRRESSCLSQSATLLGESTSPRPGPPRRARRPLTALSPARMVLDGMLAKVLAA